MTLPNTSLLASGTKIRLLSDIRRESIGGNPLEPFRKGDVVTVFRDSGGGRVNVFHPQEDVSEIVYLSESNAEVIGSTLTKASDPQ